MSHSPLPSAELPPPDPVALEQSRRLMERIGAEVDAAGGALPFERFMELALYTPGLGYYSGGARKFGAAGDFVTAPELSPLFGASLARQAVELFERLEPGPELLEIGAGSGELACTMMAELERHGREPARYLILERSAELQSRQRALIRERIPHLASRFEWVTELPFGLHGLVVGNELLDAFAVARFEVTPEGVREWWVAWSDEGPRITLDAARVEVAEAVASIEEALGAPLPVGYRSEVNLTLAPWFRALADTLEQGMALFIDYGYPRREYYLPERGDGTLLCHYRHRVHGDPLFHPGLQDITASVDFTAVAEAAHAAGFRVAGYTSQAQLLIGCGIAEQPPEAGEDEAATRRRIEWARQVKLLTLPGEMGERFQAIALTRGVEGPWRGFAMDQRVRL